MYSNCYPENPDNRFSYADGYCSVFPRGLEKRFKTENGHIVLEKEYIVLVNNDTPKEIEQRFLREYSEYYNKTKKDSFYV